MNEQNAHDQFYKWEYEQYGNNSPLSDDDRILWVQGYLYAVSNLLNKEVV
jgi:hypothetical protein